MKRKNYSAAEAVFDNTYRGAAIQFFIAWWTLWVEVFDGLLGVAYSKRLDLLAGRAEAIRDIEDMYL